MPELETLDVSSNDITDTGLEWLSKIHMPFLKEVILEHLNISRQGAELFTKDTSKKVRVRSDLGEIINFKLVDVSDFAIFGG
jgi:hypothetical protein